MDSTARPDRGSGYRDAEPFACGERSFDPMRISKARILLMVAIAGYVAAFQWMYITWLSPTFDYWGFSYEPPPMPGLIMSCLMSVLPGLWLPLNLTRPSQLITWVLFIT